MTIALPEQPREETIARLIAFFREEFDEELSAFRAERLLEFLAESYAPAIYNQAVQDARAFIQTKLDDLDGEVYAKVPCKRHSVDAEGFRRPLASDRPRSRGLSGGMALIAPWRLAAPGSLG